MLSDCFSSFVVVICLNTHNYIFLCFVYYTLKKNQAKKYFNYILSIVLVVTC